MSTVGYVGKNLMYVIVRDYAARGVALFVIRLIRGGVIADTAPSAEPRWTRG